jgi:4-hydroxy-3-methylbut-2-enyl diphosphate reductase
LTHVRTDELMPSRQIRSEESMRRSVLLASPRAFCAGVERAIAVVEHLLSRHGGPVYVRKQIVHNKHVVQDLEERGAIFVEELDEVPAGSTVVFSAHGVAPAVYQAASARQLKVVDATCPLVAKVHSEVRRRVLRGDTVVLIGHAGHEEVEGILGEAPDNTVVVENLDDIAALDLTGPISYVTQTTLAVDETSKMVAALKGRFPDLAAANKDDICYATTNRQNAVRAVAAESDVVLVVGSVNSANSARLVEVVQRSGTRAHLIDDSSSIEPSWLEGVRIVGVTAGASASPTLVAGVVDALREFGHVEVAERTVGAETISFALPKELRTA